MSLSAKREALASIHGRYQRAGRPHKMRILDEFCATCGYHRKAALRLLNRPLPTSPLKRPGPERTYVPSEVLPVLKAVWLASDQLCSKLLKAAMPEWLEHYQRRSAPLPEAFRKKLLKISPAQIDRLLQSARVAHPKKGLSATRPGTLLRHAVPTRTGPPDTTRVGSGSRPTPSRTAMTRPRATRQSLDPMIWVQAPPARAVWHKSAAAVLAQLQELAKVIPYAMKDFHTDNGGEFLNWALYRHREGHWPKVGWTRSRACRKNNNAHCEQKNWTHVRQLFGHERFGHPELVALMNDLYAREWSQFTNHFKPTFKLLKREKKDGKTRRIYEPKPQTPYQRLLASADIPEATKEKLRAEHARLDPFALKKSIEAKLKNFFTVLSNLDRESTKT